MLNMKFKDDKRAVYRDAVESHLPGYGKEMEETEGAMIDNCRDREEVQKLALSDAHALSEYRNGAIAAGLQEHEANQMTKDKLSSILSHKQEAYSMGVTDGNEKVKKNEELKQMLRAEEYNHGR